MGVGKTPRKIAWIGAVTALVVPWRAHASYILTEVRVHEGVDLDRLIVLASRTADDVVRSDIRAVTITAEPSQYGPTTIMFNRALLDSDSEPDIDFEGRAAGFRSYVRVGDASTWVSTTPAGLAKPWSDTNGDGIYTPGGDPNGTGQIDRLVPPTQDVAWTSAAGFTAGGFNSIPIITPIFLASGVPIGEFVILPGTDLRLSITLSGSAPGSEQTAIIAPQPEPSAIGVLGLASLFLRRRRLRRH
jgi:hypothetical protein